MNLITQCPACSTLFRVVPDQLRISDGWVRCGQCDEVFDANASVRSEPLGAPTAPSDQADAAAMATFAAPGYEAPRIDPLTQNAPLGESAQGAVSAPAPIAAAQAREEPEAALAPAAPVDPFLERSPKELADFSMAVTAAHEASFSAADQEPIPEPRYQQMVPPQSASQADPKLSFMRPTRAPSRWRRPWVRALLGIGCGVLSLLAVAQVVVHERDPLSAHYPQIRAPLWDFCAALGLEVHPLRQIDAMVIDSSAFSKVRSDVYKLSFALHNTAQIALATPALELTLTDSQDQVLLRRVLSPSDFSSVPSVMTAGMELNANLPVAVRAPVVADRVAGYRLLAFYP